MKWLSRIPNFDVDPSLTIAHIVEFTEFFLCFGVEQEDVVLLLFLLPLEERKRDWIKHSCNPKSISSSMILIRYFLKYWGPRTQKFEDTIQELEDAFLEHMFLLNPIEGTGETLLTNHIENLVEEEEVEDDSDEEGF